MSKIIEKLRDEKAKKAANTYDGEYSSKTGFDYAISLNIPVLFAQFLWRECVRLNVGTYWNHKELGTKTTEEWYNILKTTYLNHYLINKIWKRIAFVN